MIGDPAPPPAVMALPSPSTLIELQLPLSALNTVCRALGADKERRYAILYGCSTWRIGGCLIVVPKVERLISERDQTAVRSHEIAHCNGWMH